MMYEQNKKKGAWVSYELIYDVSGLYSISFNYDFLELLPESKRSDSNFIQEWQYYPRSKDFTPLWLQKIIKKKKLQYLTN